MTDVIEIKIEGLEKLREKLDSAVFRQQVERTMTISTSKIKYKARELVPVDSGALRSSIRDEVRYTGGEIQGLIYPTEPYAAPVEFGSRPHFPPVGALERWARKRGINPWALAVAISRKGTKPHPFMRPALEQMKDFVVKLFKDMIDFFLKR